MNTMVYEYGEEALANGSTTLKDFVYTNGTNNDSVNAYNIPIVNAYSFVIGDSCNDNNSNTINDVYKDINGTCLGEYILGATCNDTVETTYNDIYVDINGTCIGFPYLEKIYNTYYETGYSIKNIGMVKDISLSSIIKHIGTVEDSMNSIVIPHIGIVEDSMNSTINTYTGSVIDSMNSTVNTYTGSVIDSMNSTVNTYTGSVVDSMNSTSTTYTGSVIDYTNYITGTTTVAANVSSIYYRKTTLVGDNVMNGGWTGPCSGICPTTATKVSTAPTGSKEIGRREFGPNGFIYLDTFYSKSTYSCSSGTLSGSSCIINTSICPTGYTANGSNCKKTVNYNYYGYSCPTGYTATDAGYTTHTKTDPNNTTDNTTTLATAINTATAPVGNCKKTVNYNYYGYSCPTGYIATDAGLTTYTKTDTNNTINDTATLATTVNSSTAPVGNCKKTINYNYYGYSCPTGYTATDIGLLTYTKTDPNNTINDSATLATTVNTSTAPVGNCKKTVNYNYYEYSCPNGYTATDAGLTTYTKTDPNNTINDSTTLYTTVNNATAPVGNCKKIVNYDYYEYSCSTGYIATDAGYTTHIKTDSNNTTDNTTTLSTTVNNATAPVGNCKKIINYNYYEYKCPDGYTITDPGLITYTKTDPNNTIDNYTELSKDVNENISPIENCKKDIFYDYYEYKCNTEGYNTIDTGYNIYNKIDVNKNIINELELGTKVNNETPTINNCYITKYECPNGYTYDGIGCRN